MKTKTIQGSVSIVLLVGMTVMVTVLTGVFAAAVTSKRVTWRSVDEEMAYQAAQAGIELETARAVAALQSNKGLFKALTADISGDLNPILNGCVATATVAPQTDPKGAWITCTVTYNQFTKSARVNVYAKNVGIWNNAIFAGTGAAGQQINGNVTIAGSVHTLGDGEPYIDVPGIGQYFAGDPYTDTNHNGKWDPGEPYTDTLGLGKYYGPDPFQDTNGNGIYDPPLTASSLDATFSGTAMISDNYTGMPAALLSDIPAAPVVNGLQTLSTEVRVKHGLVSLSGSSTIGQSGTVSGMKTTVDGVYVNDGFTGTKGSSAVYSDNGTNNQYDLNNMNIQYPYISGYGAQTYTDSNGTSWSSQEAFLDANALNCPVTTIKATTAAFSYSDSLGNSISFTPAVGNVPATLTIYGIVRFNTDTLQIGAKDTINYQGKGTMYCDGNVNIDGNLLPLAGLTFPTSTTLGLIAKKNMNLASGNGSSQLSMCGAFYAQGSVYSAKQNNIAGTFVGNFFNMGNNVPAIYQVPSLPYNMPTGMPGDKGIYSVNIKAWRNRYYKPSDQH